MSQERILTAKEGADRVAERLRKPRGIPSSPDGGGDVEVGDDSPKYTCENCGEHDFNVVIEYNDSRSVEWSFPCGCGDTEVAATKTIVTTRSHTRTGRLNDEHRIEDDEETELELNEEETELAVQCERCFRRAKANAWRTEEGDESFEIEEESRSTAVLCSSCAHEVEFGYSHAGGGRIRPCETSDFNPWNTFPDRRFAEDWRRRDWFRPC